MLALSQKTLYNNRTSLVSVKQEGSQVMEETQTSPSNLDLPLFIQDRVTELMGAERAVPLLLDNQGERQPAAVSIPSPPLAGGVVSDSTPRSPARTSRDRRPGAGAR
jgi:hypothetical protein